MSDRSSSGGFAATPVIIGHRGAAGLEPENTLPSFARAVALGVQAVEFDVHVCGGELVVIHDDTLDRTTNGTGSVAATPLERLRALDAGNGAGVPLLSEVLAALPEKIAVNIELKGPGTAEPLAAFLTGDLTGDLTGEERREILISSFDHSALNEFKALRDDYALAPLFGRWRRDAIQIAEGFGGGYINLGVKVATASRLQAIRAAGLRALVYTVNDLAAARRLIAAGASGVFTDYPDRVTRAALISALPAP
ncbi:MAG: glycerophosphodiester phosphodiesterase family protein [Pseudomonadota bacterium]